MKKYALISILLMLVVLWIASIASVATAEIRVGKGNNKDALVFREINLVGETVSVIEGGTGTNGYGSAKIYDFPAGRILVHGVVVTDLDLDFPDNGEVTTNAAFDVALGTSDYNASGTNNALESDEIDLCAKIDADLDETTDYAKSGLTGQLAAAAQFDGTTTAKDMYLNLYVPDAGIASNVTATVNGRIVLLYSVIGDY